MSWMGSTGDEEFGKKNDDHRPLIDSAASATWSARHSSPPFRKRRIIYSICALLFVYVFIKNIPTDLGPSPRLTPSFSSGQEGKLPPESSDPPSRKPRKPATPSEAQEHYHDGPIKFYMLASSLHAVSRLGGQHESNKNVLFAASNLKSASEIIPLACEMARWDRNDVHFAIMGRDDMEIPEIKKINGVEEDCNVHWHDARPDYSRWSSDYRMEVSVAASLEHIQTFIHPQVILVDHPSREDVFFSTALRIKAADMGKPVIELPTEATESMMWMTRLDSQSLAAWTTTYIDILIQAPSGSSGSLVRLLKSIENADYFGARRPHLTIELPAEIEPSTWRYLQSLVWPPLDWSGSPHVSQVSLRHRIPRRTSTEYEASARLIESFYPVRLEDSHVLLLSPQAELSPLYYHYTIYNLLEYRYSAHAKLAKDAPNIIGISLERPSFYLNDTTRLAPPLLRKPSSSHNNENIGERTPFLWQAPDSNAALYFGNKWIEFHSFLTARLAKPPSARRKVFSEKHPSWLEFLLELMRNRGYSLLYPNFSVDEDAIATIHDELFQIPEEYFKQTPKAEPPAPDLNPNDPLTHEYERRDRKAPPNTELSLTSSTLVSILPNSGDLPELTSLPLLSYNGISITRELSQEAAIAFSNTFRQEVGGCRKESEASRREPNSAIDLFCHRDEVYDPLKPPTPRHSVPSYNLRDHEDEIPAEQELHAKGEVSAHLARQQGKSNPSDPGVQPTQPYQAPLDSGEETQTEFKLQMERQAKQAGAKVAQEQTPPKKDDPEKNEDRMGEQAAAKSNVNESKQKDTDKNGPKTENPQQISPNVEDPNNLDAKKEADGVVGTKHDEKGAGW